MPLPVAGTAALPTSTARSPRATMMPSLASLLLALGTGVLATAMGCAAGRALVRARGGWRRVATAAAFLPVVAPSIALGVGIQVVALRLGLGATLGGVMPA